MNNLSIKKLILFGAGFSVALFSLSFLGGDPQTGFYYSLVPPILAVGLAYATHNIYLSLGLSVLAGGPLIFIHEASFVTSLTQGLAKSFGFVWSSAIDSTNLQILWFAVLILTMIGIIQDSGGFSALAHALIKRVKDKKSSKWATYFLGFCVFVDDYANSMVVGSAMRPLADKFRMSREKLAFIVDATAAPISGLAVVSTWIGYEVGLFNDISQSLNLGQNGFAMFFDALSSRYYCLFMLIFIAFNIASGFDFGPMKRAEDLAENSPIKESMDTAPEHNFISIVLLPFAVLLGFLFVALWLDGKGPENWNGLQSFFSFTYWRNVISSSENNILILAQSATIGLILAIFMAFFKAKKSVNFVGLSFIKGFKKGLFPASILILAWSLKSVCESLQTGPFLSIILGDILSPQLFPLCLFIVASLIAISIGTSWGTMAILIPTAIPLAFELDGGSYGLVTIISLAAVLDGAIMGDHCSPISDSTILSSMATHCDHMAHVRTQMPYALIVALIAAVAGYLPGALGAPFWLTTLCAISLMFVLFYGLPNLIRARA